MKIGLGGDESVEGLMSGEYVDGRLSSPGDGGGGNDSSPR